MPLPIPFLIALLEWGLGGLILFLFLRLIGRIENKRTERRIKEIKKRIEKRNQAPEFLPLEEDYSEETNEERGMPSSVLMDEEDEEE